MNYKNYQMTRTFIGLLIATIVVAAIITNNFILAISGVLIGVLFLSLVKSKFKGIIVDERVVSINGRASMVVYNVATLIFAFSGFCLILISRSQKDSYLNSLGEVFCYIALLLVTIYSISYYYFNKKYGADE
jgi:uncharacterized membrane protein